MVYFNSIKIRQLQCLFISFFFFKKKKPQKVCFVLIEKAPKSTPKVRLSLEAKSAVTLALCT